MFLVPWVYSLVHPWSSETMGWSHKYDVIVPNTVLNYPSSSQPKVPGSHSPGNGSWVVEIPDFCSSGVLIQSPDSKLSQLGLHQGGNHGGMVGETFRMTQSHPHPKPCPKSRLLNTPRDSSTSLSNSFQCLTTPARETILILEFLIPVSNPNTCGRRLDSQKMLCWFLQKFLCWIWGWFRLSCAAHSSWGWARAEEKSLFPPITCWNTFLLSFLWTL